MTQPFRPLVAAVAVIVGIALALVGTPTASASPTAAPGAPTGVTGVAGNGQVAVSWTAPANPGDSPIEGYSVQYTTDGGSHWYFGDFTPTAATSRTIGGLTNGTAYQFRVSAFNASAEGPPSTPSGSITPTPAGAVTVPGAPTNVVGTPGNGQVTLNWTAPASNGGSAIVAYLVAFSDDGGSTYQVDNYYDPDTTEVISGLANGTGYRFLVAAINGNGRGDTSEPSATITPAAPGTGGTGGTGGSGGTVTTVPSLISGKATSKAIKGTVVATSPACAAGRTVQIMKGAKVVAQATTSASGGFKVKVTAKLRKKVGAKKVSAVVVANRPDASTACAAASSGKFKLVR